MKDRLIDLLRSLSLTFCCVMSHIAEMAIVRTACFTFVTSVSSGMDNGIALTALGHRIETFEPLL